MIVVCTGGEGSAPEHATYDYVQEQEVSPLTCEENIAYATIPVH